MFKFSKITGALVAAGTVLGGPLGGAIGYGIGKAISNSSESSSSSSSSCSDNNKELCYGDIIYISRGLYQHFGVYCNENSVIHYSSLQSDIGSDNEIIDTDLNTFKRDNSGIYKLVFPKKYGDPTPIRTQSVVADQREINREIRMLINSSKYHLYSPSETVERARSKLGEKKYNLLVNNCEHFAIWCKTGISESRQIDGLLEATSATQIGAVH